MLKIKRSLILSFFSSILIFLFSVFINRGITTTSVSLGFDLQMLSNSLPNTNGFLQPQRILLPVLGRLLNLELQIINIITAVLFLICLYLFNLKYSDYKFTFLIVSCLSTTMVFQFTLIYGGYPDILSYLFLALTFFYKDKNTLPYFLFFLALLSKETVVFTLPFFMGLNLNLKKLLLTIVSYLPIYFYLSKGVYSPNYFFDLILEDYLYFFKQSTENIFIGYFSAIKFLWAFIFIAILVDRDINLKPFLYLNLGIFIQFFLGGDTTRFVSFIFLAVLYIVENLKKESFKKLKVILIFILILNILTPKYYVFAYGELVIVNETRLTFIDFKNK